MFRALQHRNYKLFFSGQLISLCGTWMQTVAQAWLVYRLTESAALLGLVAFSSQIPVLLLAPLGGSFADRHNRRRILVSTQTSAMILALSLAALTLSGYVQVWHLFIFASLLGVVNAFDLPARQAFVLDMVGRADLLNAIALNSSMVNSARMIGPALAGVLVAAIGEGWCFLLNGLSYIAVIAGLSQMKIHRHARAPNPGSAISSILEGFRFVGRTAPIRDLLLLLGLISLMGMPYSVLMPIFADQILNGGPRGLGVLMGAAGLGALGGALTLAARQGVQGLGRWVIFASAGFGISLILFSVSRTFWLSVVLLIPAGYCMMVEMASSNTLIQAMAPDHLRGRVMAAYSMMFMGMAPIGALFAGFVAERLGAPSTVAIGGAACIMGSILFAVRLPAIRHQGRQMIVAIQASGGNPTEAVTGTQGSEKP